MQSVFRLPWARDSGGDKQFSIDSKMLYSNAHMKSGLDFASFAAQAKRKRMDTANSSQTDAPHVKRQRKPVEGGAVQPAVNLVGQVISSLKGMNPIMLPTPAENANALTSASKASGDTCSLPSSNSTPSVATPPVQVMQQPQPIASFGLNDNASASVMDSHPIPTEAEKVDLSVDSNLDRMRSVVDAQINLEILIKHNELRLIEQELAKCQIALEQIRRCELIPYPGAQGFSASVSQGTGPALQTRVGSTRPKHPAPFGVTDGPYTRHYAQWLLTDPSFDSQHSLPESALSHGASTSFRSARVSSGDYSIPPTPVARNSRVSTGNKCQLSGAESAQAYRDPLLMKREMDNQWVRLVCTKCRPERSNFQNIQGFLNHCRISHQDNYKSHEQAAVACGRVVEVDESTMPPPAPIVTKQRQSISIPPVSMPAARTSSVAGTPLTETAPRAAPAGYSPLVLTMPTDAGKLKFRNLVIPRKFDPSTQRTEISTPVVDTPMTSFFASPQTPNLSAFLQSKNIPGNLHTAVMQAKTKVDTSAYDLSDSENEHAAKNKRAKQKKHSGTGGARRPQEFVAGKGKDAGKPISHPVVLIPAPAKATVTASQTIVSQPHHLIAHEDLVHSPATADSSPGLVSDHEGESDDGDEVPDVGRNLPQTTFPSHRASAGLNECASRQPSDAMDIDDYIEIQDSSDTERENVKRVMASATQP